VKKYSALLAKAHYQRLEEVFLEQQFATQFKGRRVLDIGCGEGKYLRLLSPYCETITGVDTNPEQVRQLKESGFDAHLPSELVSGQYDVLLMSHIVEHMAASDLVAFLDCYLPMLHDDGHLIIMTPLPGLRFWHDFTHVRPYTPQSFGMMFGILAGPAAFHPRIRMELQEIHFFRDSWRIRHQRYYYPTPSLQIANGWAPRLIANLITLVNALLASLFVVSHGRLGVLASWAGIYKKAMR
jgi:SAM-dependent methyltransferase